MVFHMKLSIVSLIILTARSGRAALKHRLDKIGFPMDQEELDAVYTKFLDLADTRKEIYDEDLLEMLGHTRDNKIYQIDALEVTSDTKEGSTAHITLCRNAHYYTSEAKGNGPVDAVFPVLTIGHLLVQGDEFRRAGRLHRQKRRRRAGNRPVYWRGIR